MTGLPPKGAALFPGGRMYFNELVDAFEKERRDRGIFHDLMPWRVKEILLVASLYDAFVMESDGALSDQIYGEFYKLNLSAAPRVSCAYTQEAAVEMHSRNNYDIVILMAGLDFDTALQSAAMMKKNKADTTILLLAMNNMSLVNLYNDCEESLREGLENIDRVFVWNGYSKLFLGMIKYVEDKHNVDNDTRVGMVRVVLLIEDSVRYYSRYLPLLYSVVMRQTQQLLEEENSVETFKILRMRSRPKILLASNYEEASELFEKYRPYLLTVISDVRFPKDGEEDPEAGFRFLKMVREEGSDLPVLIQSGEAVNREQAYSMQAAFVDKNSHSLARELSRFFQTQLGFGPFIFRDEEHKLLASAKNLDEFYHYLQTIPIESLHYHARHNHFSVWLMARGELRIARIIRNYQVDDFNSSQQLRDFLQRWVTDIKKGKASASIPALGNLTKEHGLVRLGSGSLGGKGRGLAFIKNLIDNHAFPQRDSRIEVRLPFTAFIGIDEFDRFMEQHELWELAWQESDSESIRALFLSKELDPEFVKRLEGFLTLGSRPLAIRSSGLFEDMLMLPFSGVYETFIIPNSHPDPKKRLQKLMDAIRLVWASMFMPSARDYFDAASYKIEEERMGVVVQELVGSQNGRYYYPLIAGTAQSYNYYPVSYLEPEDGLCLAAFGLGAYVVEGGTSHRFSPPYPKLDVVATSSGIAASQSWFYGLDMERSDFDLSKGEEATLERLDINDAQSHPYFHLAASTWNSQDYRLEAGTGIDGPRVIDFASILKHGAFPFAETVKSALDICSRSMGTPVELEYAISMDEKSGNALFYLLQIKPLIQNETGINIDIEKLDSEKYLVKSERCMGNGIQDNLHDIVFIPPEKWDARHSLEMAEEIATVNEKLKAENRRFVLIGPGRWGSRDNQLGVPVNFSQISRVSAIVESDLPGFHVESSLGSHFFHNVTAMNIAYFSVKLGNESRIDWDALLDLPLEWTGKYCLHARSKEPFMVLVDGKKQAGIIGRPSIRLTGIEKNDNIYCY